MRPLALVAQLVGLALVVVLVSRLPAETFAATQTFLLVAGALLLLAVALAVALRPVRLALFRAFGVRHNEEGPAAAGPEEMRALVRPVLAALACLAVAGLAALLR